MAETFFQTIGGWLKLFRFVLQWFRSVTIKHPYPHQEFPVGTVEVGGTCFLRMKGTFALFHRVNGCDYFPHSFLYFRAGDREWTAKFHVTDAFPGNVYEMVVVELNELGAALVDFYFKAGNHSRTGHDWKPITLRSLPDGFRPFAEVAIRKKQ